MVLQKIAFVHVTSVREAIILFYWKTYMLEDLIHVNTQTYILSCISWAKDSSYLTVNQGEFCYHPC
jgi:hypothetical protein